MKANYLRAINLNLSKLLQQHYITTLWFFKYDVCEKTHLVDYCMCVRCIFFIAIVDTLRSLEAHRLRIVISREAMVLKLLQILKHTSGRGII